MTAHPLLPVSLPSEAECARMTRDHLTHHTNQVRWMIQRHMRRHATRLLQASGGYSDRCVGPQEFRELIGQPPEGRHQQWLNRHGVPPLNTIEEELKRAQALERQFTAGLAPSWRVLLPLEQLRSRFALTPEAVKLLVVAASAYLSEGMMRLMTVAWNDFTVRLPTVGFLCRVVVNSPDEEARLLEALSLRSTLVQANLVTLGEHPYMQPGTPQLFQTVRVPQRVLDTLVGAPMPNNLPGGAVLCTQPRTVESLYLDDGLHTQMVQVLDKPQPRVVLTGPDHSGRRTVSEALVWAVRGQHLLQVPLMEIIRQHGVGESQSILVNLIREAMLVDAALFLRVDEPMDADALSQLQRVMRRLSEALHQTASAVLLALPETYQGRDRLLANADEVTFAPLEPSRQQDAWRDALEGRVEEHERSITARNFAATYSTPTGTIFRVVERALERQALHADAKQPLDRALLIQEIHRQFDHNLGQLADVITTHVKLRDVVLSDHQRRQLTEVLSYARHTHLIFSEWGFSERSPYGNGLSVLFSGPPGTGKTLVAGALAHQLGRVLYRVDLSRVVDKYIGETEKNLRRIFDEAERAQAVLLFDEADSLFSKRTEVKSSNDRYANLEVNYLLQRMEQFKGVSILTTNFETGLDEAFMRRIRFKIEFPMPDIEERARLWRHLLPPAAPLEEAEEIEWELLGESFEMSGGHIRNALLRAAVRAAASNRPISQDTLMLAGMDEARELGILVNVRYDFAGYDETFDLEDDREVFGGQANDDASAEPHQAGPDDEVEGSNEEEEPATQEDESQDAT